MKTKNLKLKCLLVAVGVLATPSHLYSQLFGYGTATSTMGTYTHSSGVLYTDDTRAAVASISGTSAPYTITFNYPASVTSTFSAGDQCLLIQMVGGTVGMHEGVTINSISGTSMDVTPIVPSGPPVIHGYSLGVSDKVQIIKIPQYYNFTLSGGVVTCRPWDATNGTGGIVCMQVKNLFTVSTGSTGAVTASGKGYYPDGIVWGTPGVGGAGSNNFGTGGVNAVGGNAGNGAGLTGHFSDGCFEGVDAVEAPAGALISGYQGGAGEECTTCQGSAGTPTTGSLPPDVSPTLNAFIVMGSAGGYTAGYGAGRGGDGGGGGGGGGSTMDGVAGSNGSPGGSGGNGGESGKGGYGGGIIYIKAGTYSIPSTHGTVFYSNGGDGENGLPGENAANGGAGGIGGIGHCECPTTGNIYLNGGAGGWGKPGIGAGGGDAGNGGEPGTIWLISNTAPNHIKSSYINVLGGRGGKGGPGGFGVVQTGTFIPPVDITDCRDICLKDVDYCTPPCYSGTENHICDCDKAYQQLGLSNSTPVYNSGANTYEFFDGSTPPGLVAYYDLSNTKLVGVEVVGCSTCCAGTITNFYHCPLYAQDACDDIFYQIFQEESYAGPIPHSGDHIVSNALEVSFVDDNTSPNMTKYMEYRPAWGYIIDYVNPTSPRKCYNASCNPNEAHLNASDAHIYRGPMGEDAEPQPDGTTGDETSNAPVDDDPVTSPTTSWKNGSPTSTAVQVEINEIGIKLYPNPTAGIITLEFHSESKERIDISVLDMAGNQLINKKYTVSPGVNKPELVMTELANGTYLLRTALHGKLSVVKIVKK